MKNRTGLPGISCRSCLLTLLIMSSPLLAAVDPTTATLERSAIDEKYKWDLSKMYSSEQAWESHYKEVDSMIGKFAAKAGKVDRKSTRLNSSHTVLSRMPSSA